MWVCWLTYVHIIIIIMICKTADVAPTLHISRLLSLTAVAIGALMWKHPSIDLHANNDNRVGVVEPQRKNLLGTCCRQLVTGTSLKPSGGIPTLIAWSLKISSVPGGMARWPFLIILLRSDRETVGILYVVQWRWPRKRGHLLCSLKFNQHTTLSFKMQAKT